MDAYTKKQFCDIIDYRVNSVLSSLAFTRVKLAEVVSNDGTTLTIKFLDDTANNISGVPYLAGQTIVAGNKVDVLLLNNSLKSSSWICLKQA